MHGCEEVVIERERTFRDERTTWYMIRPNHRRRLFRWFLSHMVRARTASLNDIPLWIA